MCGFAGVVSFDEQYRVTRESLEGMAACISHRGPDGHGFHLDAHAALSHVRLAILDPDPRSDQPFQLHSKWIVYNGEIYNFRDLRRELEHLRPDYPWRTTGDTEVLLLAYDTWGPDCLPRLDGMFAFAVWDEAEQSVFLARDPMGQKPLYYAVAPNQGGVAFASELGALKNLPWADRSIDPAALTHYLSWGYIPSPLTIHKGIQKLPPSHFLSFRPPSPATPSPLIPSPGTPGEGQGEGSVPRPLPYHNASPSPHTESVPPASDSSFSSQIRSLLPQAVSRQLISDVPLGCFLSGGVDSSIIALCMKRAVPPGQRVMTFSIGFDDPRYDETPYARQVASHLGTEHHEFRVTPHAADDLPRLARIFGEPFADSSALPTHYLARETRSLVKVALSGDGGDELFGGYDRYRAMALAERLRHAAPILKGVAGAIPGVHPKSTGARAKRFARTLGQPPAQRYASYMRLFPPNDLSAILPHPDPSALNWLADQYAQLHPGRDVVETSLALDRETYLPEDLFTKVDRAAMLHALEVRSPFMDPDVLLLAANLKTPDLLTRAGGKRLLREAFAKDLPDFVFRRRKMGFALPIGQWFRGPLRDLLHSSLFDPTSFASTHLHLPPIRQMVESHQQQTQDHSQRLYALLMLELWWRHSR